MCVGHLITKIL
jgi:hypothetical protein